MKINKEKTLLLLNAKFIETFKDREIEDFDKNIQIEYEKQISICREIIHKYFSIKTFKNNGFRSTYGLKHDFERHYEQSNNSQHHHYICEYACGAALLFEGYTSNLQTADQISSLYFNISKTEYIEFIYLSSTKKEQRKFAQQHKKYGGHF